VRAATDTATTKHFFSPRGRYLLLGAVLAVATALVYLPVQTHPFLNFDDSGYVTTNVNIQTGLDWDTVRWSFTTFREANWHPLTWISHAIDCQLFDLNPAGHHLMNVAFHVLNALLLFWVLARATGYMGRSFMVAALFALHPINVETVAWIAERKNLLSMLFFLLALGAYRWYAYKPRPDRYAVVALLYVLGLMAKPQIITLPCVLLLWDYWPLRRVRFSAASFQSSGAPLFPHAVGETVRTSADKVQNAGAPSFRVVGERVGAAELPPVKTFSYLLLEKLPLFLIAGASALITVHVQRLGGATNWYPRSVRIENAIVAYASYIVKTLWPAHLAPLYPHPDSFALWQVLGALVLLLAITALVVLRPGQRYLAVGWLWFLGALVPMLGLIQVGGQAMADRYAYLPLIGLFIMLCWGIADWAAQRHLSPRLLTAASIAILLALTTITHRQLGYWSDNVTLWSHTLQVTKNNFIAENSLGAALELAGKEEEAIPHFRAAVAINPLDAASNINVADYERIHGNSSAAIERYRKVAATARNNRQKAEAYSKMADTYSAMGDPVRAREAMRSVEDLQRGQ
jgi:tetratricopeptide (TPR) repeat protein